MEQAYLEDLLARFGRNLLMGNPGIVGDALVAAKRSYYQEHVTDAFHTKTLIATTLYGLPMLEVRTPGTQGAGSASQESRECRTSERSVVHEG